LPITADDGVAVDKDEVVLVFNAGEYISAMNCSDVCFSVKVFMTLFITWERWTKL